jgi:hypothetical protein
LDKSATAAESASAALKFMASLKARKVIGSDFEALLEMDEPEVDQAVADCDCTLKWRKWWR